MIQLDEKTAIEIEKAAAESLKQYGDGWTDLNSGELLDRKNFHLNEINEFDAYPLDDILTSDKAEKFMGICVRLAIIQTLLTKSPGYRSGI